MSNLWESLIAAFVVSPPLKSPVEDPTIYQVQTTTGKYSGKIVYQDDTMMLLKITKPKAIKILKSNIVKISMIQTELTR